MKKEKNNMDLEFLAQKSSFFLEKQIESYKYKHTISGTVITVIVLFIPFFISGLEKSSLLIKIISLIPLSGLIFCLINFVLILKTKSLDFGFNPSKFDNLINSNYEEVLLYEIGANRDSFNDNMLKIESVNTKFHNTITYTLISIIISILILIITNFINMNDNNPPKDDNTTVRVIPTVPPSDRVNLNDTLIKPKDIK